VAVEGLKAWKATAIDAELFGRMVPEGGVTEKGDVGFCGAEAGLVTSV
jgi:hypothetical protein